MTGHLTGFLVYMLAMLGVIFIAIVVVKKSLTLNTGKRKNNFLKVESSLSLEPRKTLYVVKAGNERFLVSTGIEGCQFMTKIGEDNIQERVESSDMYINKIKELEPSKSIKPDIQPITRASQIKIPAINLGRI